MTFQPQFIGLCGHPTAGKTEVQKILERLWGAVPVDDGLILRDFACIGFNLSRQDVTTQEGKAKKIVVAGQEMTVRQLLGRTGKALEREFGEEIIPEIALNRLEPIDFDAVYSFGSVRKGQGRAFKRRSNRSLIVEIVRPGVGPSGNDFDRYDESLVDIRLHNPGTTLEELERIVARIFGPYLGEPRLANAESRTLNFDVV